MHASGGNALATKPNFVAKDDECHRRGGNQALKYKYLRSNHSPFMNKDISKAIMDLSCLVVFKEPIT